MPPALRLVGGTVKVSGSVPVEPDPLPEVLPTPPLPPVTPLDGTPRFDGEPLPDILVAVVGLLVGAVFGEREPPPELPELLAEVVWIIGMVWAPIP